MTADISQTPSPHLPGALVALMPRLAARARRLTPGPMEAEDLAQDVALALWRKIESGARIDDLDRYAMTALRHLAATRWRSRHITDELEENSAATLPEAPARIACAAVADAVDRLPEDQAVLIRAVAAGETSPAALARLLGLPEGTVMSRLARARARLRSDMGLEGRGIADLLEDAP